MNIRFITDSASDMIDSTRQDLSLAPLTVTFGNDSYEDGVDLSHEEFYNKLIESDQLPTTSQVPMGAWEDRFEEVKQAGDVAVVVTISSRLSGTYHSACMAAEEYQGVIYVVDSENVTIGERCLVEYGLRMKDKGADVREIVEELNRVKKDIHLVALLDTLEYLKKGGRVSRTVAFAGGLLSIKPVIGIENGEVQMLGKARGSRQGNNLLVQQIHKYGGIDFDKPYYLGYTGLDDSLLQKYVEDSRDLWKDHTDHLEAHSVGGTIGTHAGPGAIAVAYYAKEK